MTDVKSLIGQPSPVTLTEMRSCGNCMHRHGENPTYARCWRYGGRFTDMAVLYDMFCGPNLHGWAPRQPKAPWWRRLLGIAPAQPREDS